MSHFIYLTKENQVKKLSTYEDSKEFFKIVQFNSIGRWNIKPKKENENDIKYIIYRIQQHCIENKIEEDLNLLKVKCLCTYILLFDSDEAEYISVFKDLNVQPYGFFYSSIEHLLKVNKYFDSHGILEIIKLPEEIPNKNIIDLKFEKVISKNKEIFNLTASDFIQSMHRDKSFKSYYNKIRKNEFYTYDIPVKLQRYFGVNKELKDEYFIL